MSAQWLCLFGWDFISIYIKENKTRLFVTYRDLLYIELLLGFLYGIGMTTYIYIQSCSDL